MDNQTMMTLIPLTDEEVKDVDFCDVIALYQDDSSNTINVGKPSLSAYKPIIANMYGYQTSQNKGYYLELKEEIDIQDKPIYQVNISTWATIISAKRLNDIEYNDLLSSYIKSYQKER